MCLFVCISHKKEEKRDDDGGSTKTNLSPEHGSSVVKEKEGKVAHSSDAPSSSKLELTPKSSHKSERKLDSEKIVVIRRALIFVFH
jgi:hypothetical protein